MTLKKLSILWSLAIASIGYVQGQYSFKEHYFKRNGGDSKNFVQIEGFYGLNSTAITNAMSNKLYFGGFIDDEIKSSSYDRITSLNQLGFDFQAGIQYKRKLDKFTFTAGIDQSVQGGAQFSKNLYELIFYGNEPYAGQNMTLTNTEARIYGFRTYSLGFEKDINSIFFGASINLYQGTYFYETNVERGTLYTNGDGSGITFDTKMDLTTNYFPSEFSPGAGLDFHIIRKYEKGMAFIEVEDLGFVTYRGSSSLSADSLYSWEGLYIEDLFTGSEDVDFETDSLHQILGVEVNNGTITRWAPTRINIGIQSLIGEKILLETVANYRILPNYTPQVIVKPNYFFNKNLSIAPVVGIGGYGKLDLGLNISYHHTNYFAVLDFNEFENLISKNNTSGRNVFLKIGYLF